MKKSLFIVCLFTLLQLQVYAQTKTEKAVVAAVDALRKAMIDADKGALERLTSESLSYGHSSGTIEDKTSFIRSLVNGESDFVTIELTDRTVKVINDVALVRHKLTGTTNNFGKPGTVNLGVLLVWQKERSGWRLLARQAYKL